MLPASLQRLAPRQHARCDWDHCSVLNYFSGQITSELNNELARAGPRDGILMTMDNRIDETLSIISENTLDSGFMLQLSAGERPLTTGV